jgi:predicted RNA-binding protein YlxR (DUF448 family)
MNIKNLKLKNNQMRKCIVTGYRTNKNELIRFVVSPEKVLVADLKNKLPGRGIWVKATREILEKAIVGNMFSKSAKEKINVEPDLINNIENQIRKQILNQISLARKAGVAIFGFEKVRSALTKQTKFLLIQAYDGSMKELARLSGRIEKRNIISCLNGLELGLAFGRDTVIHCVILNSGFIEKIVFDANRLNNLKNPLPNYKRRENDRN